jgi:hypothetical protein
MAAQHDQAERGSHRPEVGTAWPRMRAFGPWSVPTLSVIIAFTNVKE